MRIVELLNNVSMPITNEEAELLEYFNNESDLIKAKLSEREQVVANNLVNRDVLYRLRENDRIIYRKKAKNQQRPGC
jgi:transcription initiation factor IIE alpha subunit